MAETFVPKRRQLHDYLPHCVRDIRELRAITDAEEMELTAYFGHIEQALRNIFIADADEDGIARFETMLGISPRATDTLEERRFRIQAKFGKQPPYTIRRLRSMLATLCGEGNFSAEIENGSYVLTVKLGVAAARNFEDVETMLGQVVPQNISFTLAQLYNTHEDIKAKAYTHGGLHELTHSHIRTEEI